MALNPETLLRSVELVVCQNAKSAECLVQSILKKNPDEIKNMFKGKNRVPHEEN